MSVTESGVDLRQKTTADLEYRIAATREERAAAFRLVYESYLEAGLSEPNPQRMRVTPYHLLPTTETFIAVCDGLVISTVSLVIDGQLGLPMESVYPEEVAEQRRLGRYVGEVSCLADRRRELKRLFPVYIQLCRLMAQYARRRGLDGLMAAVHPRHARFYERFMAFQPVGELKTYQSVCDNPAIALSLDFARVEQEYPDIWQKFFGEPIPEEQLQPRPIPRAERDYFWPAVAGSFDHPAPDEAQGPLPADDALLALGAA